MNYLLVASCSDLILVGRENLHGLVDLAFRDPPEGVCFEEIIDMLAAGIPELDIESPGCVLGTVRLSPLTLHYWPVRPSKRYSYRGFSLGYNSLAEYALNLYRVPGMDKQLLIGQHEEIPLYP